MKSEQDRRGRALSTIAGVMIALAAFTAIGLALSPVVAASSCDGVYPWIFGNADCASPAAQSPSPAPQSQQQPQAGQDVNAGDIPEANSSPPAAAIAIGGAAAQSSQAVLNACDIPELPGC